MPLDEIDLLVIENVGNLVCPAEFRVGEDARVMVSSVTEGEDKPLKYPLMFRACELVLVNKVDLLPHLDIDLDRCSPTSTPCIPTSPTHGRQRAHRRGRRRSGGDWLARARRARAAARRRVTPRRPPTRAASCVERAWPRARDASGALLRAEAGRIAALCHADGRAVRARRPAARDRLLGAARSDAHHVAVEFVHPVIVGKRALPAIGLSATGSCPTGSRCSPCRTTS